MLVVVVVRVVIRVVVLLSKKACENKHVCMFGNYRYLKLSSNCDVALAHDFIWSVRSSPNVYKPWFRTLFFPTSIILLLFNLDTLNLKSEYLRLLGQARKCFVYLTYNYFKVMLSTVEHQKASLSIVEY
jgi:hypothetical protein